MASKICLTISGARPSDGSSSSSSFGRAISARPIDSICCSPPDSVPPRWAMRSFRRGNSVKTFSTSSSKYLRLSRLAPICRFSITVMRGKMRRPSGDCAMRRRAISCVGMWVMSVPAKVIVPVRARGLPKMVIISVDLPAPLAPISATISPSLTSNRRRSARRCCRSRSRRPCTLRAAGSLGFAVIAGLGVAGELLRPARRAVRRVARPASSRPSPTAQLSSPVADFDPRPPRRRRRDRRR